MEYENRRRGQGGGGLECSEECQIVVTGEPSRVKRSKNECRSPSVMKVSGTIYSDALALRVQGVLSIKLLECLEG